MLRDDKQRGRTSIPTYFGYFAARALLRPEEYAGEAMGIAGDELDFEDACKVFRYGDADHFLCGGICVEACYEGHWGHV